MPSLERQPGSLQSFDEAGRPVVARERALGPSDESEAGVALLDEMVDRGPCTGTAVDVDPGMIVGEITAPEGDERGSGVEQDADPLVVMHCAGEDEAVDGATTHHLPIGVGLALTPVRREEMDVHAGIGGALSDLVEEGVEGEPIPVGRDAVPDGEGAPLGQGAGGAVEPIAEPIPTAVKWIGGQIDGVSVQLDGRMAWFQDTEGNIIGIGQPVG